MGTTNSSHFYCSSGPNCNNPSGRTCWNPILGVQATTSCSSSQWQCTVNDYLKGLFYSIDALN